MSILQVSASGVSEGRGGFQTRPSARRERDVRDDVPKNPAQGGWKSRPGPDTTRAGHDPRTDSGSVERLPSPSVPGKAQRLTAPRLGINRHGAARVEVQAERVVSSPRWGFLAGLMPGTVGRRHGGRSTRGRPPRCARRRPGVEVAAGAHERFGPLRLGGRVDRHGSGRLSLRFAAPRPQARLAVMSTPPTRHDRGGRLPRHRGGVGDNRRKSVGARGSGTCPGSCEGVVDAVGRKAKISRGSRLSRPVTNGQADAVQ